DPLVKAELPVISSHRAATLSMVHFFRELSESIHAIVADSAKPSASMDSRLRGNDEILWL
ncbi:hypothetical protein, partial [Sphingomonas sp. Leaf5]|uniref:hypothetical protein n=1 Tax=Sphingomonas sp. Leaf5 TaxID=1735671 RepID=UPI001F1DE8EE